MQTCPCGAALTPIEGEAFCGPNGELCQVVVCHAGHRFGVARVREHGPCPSCGHRWQETVRGGDPERIAAAPTDSPQAASTHDLAVQLGLGGCV